MKKTLGALFALGIFAALPAGAQAATVKPAPVTDAASAIVKVEYDGYHGRWSSHQRYGSGGSGGHSYGHYRWRSHQRYGSGGSGGSGGFGYGEGGGGDGHSRHLSHERHGSGGFGYGEKEHRRSHSHRRYGSESGFGY